ncbi:hypothetical protein SERLA73DRAFT_176371 [Serpula lacrymans var. lacrymans S7.3]|uniref:Uncharacterized protein n=2 Tax=Serpula lacrymans var. lacrymans TaxID=341189 RepID=F8PMS5_SERL3|nr:uncharacterized protein SERLADRAFT_459214 [Serpula lacrymans var. lacrymans S7.9]EGO02907.1 hypothetical protein SERLA73DRAFT_176371 [Serpula lacrymans var. lacrymans S7.3]EGO28597.1 hypothetical protein SERLADRAFT_459214 [Serpula lacrymans var. lacrymans S7.9]
MQKIRELTWLNYASFKNGKVGNFTLEVAAMTTNHDWQYAILSDACQKPDSATAIYPSNLSLTLYEVKRISSLKISAGFNVALHHL